MTTFYSKTRVAAAEAIQEMAMTLTYGRPRKLPGKPRSERDYCGRMSLVGAYKDCTKHRSPAARRAAIAAIIHGGFKHNWLNANIHDLQYIDEVECDTREVLRALDRATDFLLA